MENSDSDTENECFESAEESIDEDDKNELTTRSKTSLTEGGSESPEPVEHCVEQFESVTPVHQVNEDTSSNLRSFRKRPERVKRLHSKPSNKTISKSTDELIFKADKIVSDVFFQEVTSNLSKNINRSLSTLQQTSSNVKELIFNSLPVSTLNDNEGFSYDDKNSFSTSANAFQDHNEFDYTGDVGGNNNKIEESNKEKISITELNFSSGQSGDINDKKPPAITSDNSKNIVNIGENCHNLEVKVLADKIKEEHDVIEEQIPESPDGTGVDPSLINSNDDSDVVKNPVSPNECADSKNSEVLGPNDQKGAVSKEISLEKTIKSSENEKPNNNNLHNIDKISNNPRVNEKESEEKQNLIKDESVSSTIFKNSSKECSDMISSSENTDSSGSSILKAEKHISDIPEEKLETDSECNVKELTMALKNIICEDKTNVENASENLEKAVAKEEVIFEGKLMENQNYESSKEGWDDFDFSDNEDENLGIKKDNTENDCLKEKDKLTSKSTNYVFKKENPKIDSAKSCTNKSVAKDLLRTQGAPVKMDRKSVNNEIIEIKPVAEDVWEWDAWDDVTEDSTGVSGVKEVENSESEEPKDLSKWSGWDNFGQKPEEKGGNWSLGSWGVDVLLNKATAVTQGISNVLEAGLGAPDPETLARLEKKERENVKVQSKEEIETGDQQSLEVSKKNSMTNVNLFPVSGITSLVAGVTSKIVEHSKIQEIGSKVLSGGLDTLETFGKKTMEVLQEGDPGLRNKRAFLLGDKKPVLSQVLKEAREKADRELKQVEERELARKCHFETLFDDFQGMVHLEALEMLSKQYELKLEQLRMSSDDPESFDETLKEVEELCSLYECDSFLRTSAKLDFKIKLQMAVKPLVHQISIERIIQIHENACSWLQKSSETKPSLNVVNQKLVSTLAELSAAAVQVFHKSGELLSVKECRETVEEVDTLLRLTDVLCTEINGLHGKFMLLFKETSNETSDEKVNSLSENATTIMTNSISYIRQAFNLLIPVLQFGAAVY